MGLAMLVRRALTLLAPSSVPVPQENFWTMVSVKVCIDVPSYS